MCWMNAIYWTQAIMYQGARTISAHGVEGFALPSNPTRLEEQFFLNACEKAVRNVQVLRALGKDESIRRFLPTKALRAFIRDMDSNGIRNLREHEDAYLKPDGRSLEDEVADVSRPEGDLTILVGPGITVKRDGEIIIGGRLNVGETTQIAKSLNVHLVPAQHEYSRSTMKVLEDVDAADYPYSFAPTEIG